LLSRSELQREEAYALVQRNATLAWEESRPLKELLKADRDVIEHLNPDEIDRCFDDSRYVRNAGIIFDRLEAL
jgi:adenylosuccinate lyase